MIKKIKHIIKDEKGSSEIIEVMLTFPVIIMLIFGFICFMFILRESVVIESAARTGARVLGITGEIDMAVSKAREEIKIGGVAFLRVQDISIDRIPGKEEDECPLVVKTGWATKIPFSGRHSFLVERKTSFYREEEPLDYGKETHEQARWKSYYVNPYL